MSKCIDSKYVKEYTTEQSVRDDIRSVNAEAVANRMIPTLNRWLLERRDQLKRKRYKRYGFLCLKKEPVDSYIKLSTDLLNEYIDVRYQGSDIAVANRVCKIIQKKYDDNNWKVVYKNKRKTWPGGLEADIDYIQTKFYFYPKENKLWERKYFME